MNAVDIVTIATMLNSVSVLILAVKLKQRGSL